MYIRRKVFSTLVDEAGEERLFSTTDFVYDDRYFSEKKKKLRDIESHRGLGRSLIIGGLPGAIGGYAGKRSAEKADEEGLEDYEIVRKASKTGGRAGAAIGAGLAAAASALTGPKSGRLVRAAGAGLTGGIFGGAGGYLGARKNTKERLSKRAGIEQ